ncbi:MAG: hypothetical protein RMM17_00305 [Acidobacteriota bacterium]|nr:hypothetical protein [Acidobacteriota bacterium]
MIDEIHRLTAKNNLEIDSDISFEREKDSPGKLKLRSGKEDLSKEYPSIKASFAVIGRYSDIRSFISELESSELFLIVEGIRLNSEKEALLSVELSIRCYFRQQ